MIGHMNGTIVRSSLRALHLYSVRANYAKLLRSLKIVRNVRQAQMTVQCFLSVYDYPNALDVIKTTHEVLRDDMHGVMCFRHLATQVCSRNIS